MPYVCGEDFSASKDMSFLPVTAVVMSVGSLVGVPPGSKLSVKLPDKLLQSIVIVLIFIAAVLMIFKNGH